MSAVPALAAAMAALLMHLRPLEVGPSASERDELRLWLVAAALAVLVR